MGTAQVTACGLQGLGGRLEILSLQEMLKWSSQDSLVWAELVERILKLVLGRELCTHDSRFSGAGMTERCLQGHRGSVFSLQSTPFQAPPSLSI